MTFRKLAIPHPSPVAMTHLGVGLEPMAHRNLDSYLVSAGKRWCSPAIEVISEIREFLAERIRRLSRQYSAVTSDVRVDSVETSF